MTLPCSTARKLIEKGALRLAQRGIDEAGQHSEWLLSSVTARPRLELRAFGDIAVSAQEAEKFLELIELKSEGWPLSYLTGEQPFCGFTFKVSPAVLIPRPETEGLTLRAAELLRGAAGPEILEIGAGSGCIACTLARLLPSARIPAADISGEALAAARLNAGKLQVADRISFLNSDIFSAVEGRFDMIISNPPYIPSADIAGLQTEVRFEPKLALDGGEDGLAVLRKLITGAPAHLKPAGILALEIGYNQEASLAAFLSKRGGWENMDISKDDFGINRYILATCNSNG